MHRPVTMNDALPVCEIFSSIQGEGYLAGRRQIFVRLTECNLDCSYCDTPYVRTETCRVESLPGSNVFNHLPQPIFRQTLLNLLKSWSSQLPAAHHSVSITGGEPLLSADVLANWLPEIRRIIPVHLETNGTLYAALSQVVDQVDFISMDMKLPSTAGCSGQLWDMHRLFLQTAAATAVSVKIVVGDTTTAAEILQACSLVAEFDSSIPLFLQPLTLPGGGCGIAAVQLLQLQALAAEQLPDVRVIPQMHTLLGVL